MHLHPFQNYHSDHDFSSIYAVVAEYYPLTEAERLTDVKVQHSHGFKKLSAVVQREFINQKVYREKWDKLKKILKKELKKPVSASPEIERGSSFSGEVELEKTKLPDFIRAKSLHFYISALGPFFSIYGVDSSTAVLPMDFPRGPETGNFHAVNVLTISPIFEYELMFKTLEEQIRSYFPSYKFVPYGIGMSTIRNISFTDDSWDPRMMDTVYEGIYGRAAVHNCHTRGDQYYGYNDWLKPLSKKEKSLLDEITEHSKNYSGEITVHKVWKFKESKRLGTFIQKGNLTFGMELYDVIDLTDKFEVILISEEARGTPGKISYTIQDNRIKFSPYFSFRITEVTEDTLTLVLKVEIESGDVSLKGEIQELKYVRMIE